MRWRVLAGVSVVVGLVVGVGWPAVAADSQGGLWWYSAMGVPEVQAAGVTGAGVTVAVIDSQINTQVAQLSGAGVKVHEPSYCKTADGSSQWAPADTTVASSFSVHGTDVVSMIVGTGKGVDGAVGVSGVAPKATVRFYAVSNGESTKGVLGEEAGACPGTKVVPEASAVVQAVDDGARIISLSVGGVGTDEWLSAVAWAQHQGVIVVVALPNEAGQAAGLLANGTVHVGSVGPDLQPPSWEDDTLAPTVRAPGDQMLSFGSSFDQTTAGGRGTSLATPLVAGVLADVWSKYPTATGNQVLQSLVRNTGSQDHDLDWDKTLGYGLVGLRHMLAHDPTQYPDVNPVLSKDGSGDPNIKDLTAADVANATRPDWAPGASAASASPVEVPSLVVPSPSSTDAVTPDRSGLSSLGVWLWVGVGVVVLVVVAVVLTAVLLTRKPRTPRGGQ